MLKKLKSRLTTILAERLEEDGRITIPVTDSFGHSEPAEETWRGEKIKSPFFLTISGERIGHSFERGSQNATTKENAPVLGEQKQTPPREAIRKTEYLPSARARMAPERFSTCKR
jgi:hypothetical protein